MSGSDNNVSRLRLRIRYLGRIVAADGYRLDPKNIKSATDLVKQKPKMLGEVTRLLGMVGYFRKYIANFSKKAAPLHQLLKKLLIARILQSHPSTGSKNIKIR